MFAQIADITQIKPQTVRQKLSKKNPQEEVCNNEKKG